MTLVRWMSAEARLNVFGRSALTSDRAPVLKYVRGVHGGKNKRGLSGSLIRKSGCSGRSRRKQSIRTDDIAQRMNLREWGSQAMRVLRAWMGAAVCGLDAGLRRTVLGVR